MSENQVLLSNTELAQLFEANVRTTGDMYSHQVDAMGVSALSLVLSGTAATDPNEVLTTQGKSRPILNWALRCVFQRNQFDFFQGRKPSTIDVSVNPKDPWPADVGALSPHERLAAMLIRQGADPWVQDSEGKDALDWAVLGQSLPLIKGLLAHPSSPSIENLQTRTISVSGHELPWLHALAYFNAPEIFKHLTQIGFDPMLGDKQRRIPLAWVNSSQTLFELFKNYDPAKVSGCAADIGKAWSWRENKKLSVYSFPVSNLQQMLADFATTTEEDKESIKLFDMIDKMLSANPNKQTYDYKGYRWGVNSTHQDMIDTLSEKFSWRKTQKAGAAKGSWSLPAAAVWGCVRGERHPEALTALSLALEDVLNRQSPEDQSTWASETIRPGLTNAGLVSWGLGRVMSTRLREMISPGLEGENGVQVRLRAASNAVRTLWTPNSASPWEDMLSFHWNNLANAEGVGKSGSIPSWHLEDVSTLSEVGLYHPDLQRFTHMINHLCSALKKMPGNDPSIEFDLVAPTLSLTSKDVLGYAPKERDWEEFTNARSKLWSSFAKVMDANPSLSLSMKNPKYPFTAKSDKETDLPTAEQWDSMVKRWKLSAISRQHAPQEAPSSKNKPAL